MPIVNRDRFPDVDFFPAAQWRVIGTVAENILIQIGTEQGSNAPVIARTDTKDEAIFRSQELTAVPLYELLKFSQGEVEISEAS